MIFALGLDKVLFLLQIYNGNLKEHIELGMKFLSKLDMFFFYIIC